VAIKRVSKLAETLAQDILMQICRDGVVIGSQLPSEVQMLEDYGVGRGSLREALRILEIHGIIRVKAGIGGGPIVQGATTKDLGRMATIFFQASNVSFQEVIDARLVLEPMLARLAATQCEPLQVDDLLAVQTSTESDQAYLQTSAGFHRKIAAMSGNRILSLFSHAIEDIFHERVIGMLFPSEKRDEVVCAHDAIAAAIAAEDPDAAERLMREHMIEYVRYVEERYPALMDEIVTWQ
jgi:GntR family transcriptional repressor for pyruvate dehydrogenase complex